MTLTLFHTDGCHLCAAVEGILLRLGGRFDFTVVRVDIASDPAAYARYATAIPVVWLDGIEVARYPVDEAVLARRLAARGGP